MTLLLMSLLLLAPECFGASSSVPFYVREMKSERDIGAMNENFRAASGFMKSVESRLSDVEDSESNSNIFTNGITIGTSTTAGIYSIKTNTDGSLSVPAAALSSSFTFITAGVALAASNAINIAQSTVTVYVDGETPLWAMVNGAVKVGNSDGGHICDVMIDGVSQGRSRVWAPTGSGLNFAKYTVPLTDLWFFPAGQVSEGLHSFALNCYDPCVMACPQGTFAGSTVFGVYPQH